MKTHRSPQTRSRRVARNLEPRRAIQLGTLLLVATISTVGLGVLQPTSAAALDLGFGNLGEFEWEGSKAEDATAKGVDALLVRPLAAIRVAVGAVFMVPASLFAAPGGRETLDAAYEVLLEQPIEYAFRRDLGDFD